MNCDVKADDLKGFTQCHFFAGIGGWSYALRLAGWPDERPVWTGSCPCQPFSAAGKRKGKKDARHLWPQFRRLIGECGPAVVFGEQVASKDGREWLSGVRADLERMGRAVGAADLCAASVRAPHIRQRLWFVSDTKDPYRWPELEAEGARSWRCRSSGMLLFRDLPDAERAERRPPAERRDDFDRDHAGRDEASGGTGADCEAGLVGEPNGSRSQSGRTTSAAAGHGCAVVATGGDGAWGDFDVLQFTDGKARRVEAGTFPLAHGVPGRVGLLRGYGNAIVPHVAAEFILAYREVVEA